MLAIRDISRCDRENSGRLLDRITLAVGAGDRVGLVGPTGSGKTMLLRAMALLDPVDEGEIRWHQRSVRGSLVPKFRTHVMYLHQRPVLLEGTVEDNLRLPFALQQHRWKQFDRQCVVDWLGRLGRDETFLAKGHHDLSGGEGQLVALLRALALGPQVLLLDEPTAALDRPTAAEVERLVSDWLADQSGERAYVWVSHDPDQAERMCAKSVRLRNGRIEQ